MRRRRLMVVGASAITVGVATAGCFESSPQEPADTGTEEASSGKPTGARHTPTETTTPAGNLDQLDLSARITEESSEATPTKLRTELTNTGESLVKFYTGPTLVFRANGKASEHDLLLYPNRYIGPNETPTEPSTNCWRYTDDHFLVQSEAVSHTLGPEQSLTETHSVYTVGEDTPCLPDGEYSFFDEVWTENESQSMTLTVTVKDGELEATASESME